MKLSILITLAIACLAQGAEPAAVLTAPVRIPIVVNGKEVGSQTAPASSKITVLREDPTTGKALIKTSLGQAWVDQNCVRVATADASATPVTESTPPTVAPKPTPTATPKPASTSKVPPTQANTTPKDPLLAPDVWDGTKPLPGEWEEWASGPNWQIKTCTKPAAFLGYAHAPPLSAKAEYRHGKLVRIDLRFVDRDAPKKAVEAAKKEISEIQKGSSPDETKLADAKKRLEAAEAANAVPLQEQAQKWNSEIIQPIAGLVRKNYPDDKWKIRGSVLGDENHMLVFHGATGYDSPDNFSIAITRRYQPEESVKPAKPDPSDAAPQFWALDPEFWSDAGSDAGGQKKTANPLFGLVPDYLLAQNGYHETSVSAVSIIYHSKWYKGTPQEKVERFHEVEKTVLSNLLSYFPATWKNSAPAAEIREFANDTFTASMFTDENYVSVRITKVKK